MMNEPEKRYTLEEARVIIQASLCLTMHGTHDLRQTISTTFMGQRYLSVTTCTRCGLELFPWDGTQ